jgi:arylsulfatase A-like enzyme
VTKAGKWKEAVQAYLAATAYTDMNVGRVLDALDKSPERDNTIICFWCDHGWHLGEKEHWRKFALWEEATRSPLIWVVPGLTKAGATCERTVDFMTVYPTVCDLCGIPIPKHVQGESIKSLLADPSSSWDKPALMTYLQNNHAVRNEQWRYIRYYDGGEELYDHSKDPNEWTNLANNPEFAQVKADLAKWLPKENHVDLGRKGSKLGEEEK